MTSVFPPSSRGVRTTVPFNDEKSPNSAAVRGTRADGASGTRTRDLLGAIQALSQLSYSPSDGSRTVSCRPRAIVATWRRNAA